MNTYNNEWISEGTQTHNWAVVLVDCDDSLIQRASYHWFGVKIPKSFCCFAGTQTMLEHSWARAVSMVAAEQVVTVCSEQYRCYLEQMETDRVPGQIIYQPADHGSAPALFLALAHIMALDPLSNVIVLPADQFIAPSADFTAVASNAFDALKLWGDHALLMGAESNLACCDYCWIDTPPEDYRIDYSPYVLEDIRSIRERPHPAEANRLYRRRALWNTGILVARSALLWRWGYSDLPKLFDRMEAVLQVIKHCRNGEISQNYMAMAVSNAYYRLPEFDIGHDLIRLHADDCFAVRLTGVDWDDWGRPERIVNSIRRHHLQSNFFRDREPVPLSASL